MRQGRSSGLRLFCGESFQKDCRKVLTQTYKFGIYIYIIYVLIIVVYHTNHNN